MSRPGTLEDAMPKRSRFIVAAIGVVALAACGRTTPATDAGLQRDLDLAKGQGLELAPQGSARSTLSADELSPAGNRTPSTAPRVSKSPAPRQPAPVRSEPRVVEQHQAPAPAQAPVVQSHDTVVATAPATPRPSAADAISPPPPGGYKTMGELIRKAPFPINP